jgi:DNA-binding transcriptional LysR family regulator
VYRDLMSKMLSDLSRQQLECFITVADAGSFAKASQRLGMSTSGISKTVARFEQSYGLRLLHRSTHSVSLTEEGERLIPLAREACASLRRFDEEIGGAAVHGVSGRVRISGPMSFLRTCIVPLLPELLANYPELQLDLRSSNDIVDLAADGIDIALRSGNLVTAPGLVQQRWFEFPWVFCASSAYVAAKGAPSRLEELDEHDLIGFRNARTGRIRDWGAYKVPTEGFKEPRLAFDDGDAAWDAAMSGLGIVCAPLWLAASQLRLGDAVEVLRDVPGDQAVISIVRRERVLTARRVEVAIEFLKAKAGALQNRLAREPSNHTASSRARKAKPRSPGLSRSVAPS